MFSERVRQDDDVEHFGDKLIGKVGKRWRVYEDASYYSQVSGGVGKKGKAMRDVDNLPVSFDSRESAEAWITGGCRVVDEKGNPLKLR